MPTRSLSPATGVYSYVWDVGALAVGQSGVITLYGRIDPDLAEGFSFSNTATIAARWMPRQTTTPAA